eukprot:CAMPEP_0174278366 /NCGR_PEP_ID=MMETSP0439-20130205/61437_1 /TAXON_ID=0 /ORGANISM="Stereomyxa ramosa, Strain Chinc5" /LENGTH=75 /DNA_ID=CAMNT_0015370769 /DNA_START=360 /DNA_END=584 /DNA_ORIENTATION=-
MIIFGGKNEEGYFNDVYSLDLKSFVWKCLSKSCLDDADMPSPRAYHTSVLVGEDFTQMFVFGGMDEVGVALGDSW